MENFDSFTEGNVKQPAIRSCMNTNSANTNNLTSSDNVMLPSGDATNNDQYNSSLNRLKSETNINEVDIDKEVDENYTSTSMSSRSNSSCISDPNPSDSENPKSSEIQQAISVAAMLQHGANESLQENIQPYSESNEEGYDSDSEQVDETKLLEFMLQNSQSQEEFHNQYDQLTSSLKEGSSEKLSTETCLSETNNHTTLDNLNSSSALSEQTSETEKQCWICFASEKDDPSAVWTSPCRYVSYQGSNIRGVENCLNFY